MRYSWPPAKLEWVLILHRVIKVVNLKLYDIVRIVLMYTCVIKIIYVCIYML